MKRLVGILVLLLAFVVPVWAQHREGKGGQHGGSAAGHNIPAHGPARTPAEQAHPMSAAQPRHYNDAPGHNVRRGTDIHVEFLG